MTKQNRNKLEDTENKLIVVTWEGVEGWVKKVAGIKK